MEDHCSERAIRLASELAQQPELDGVWRDGIAVSWASYCHETIVVHKITGVDICQGAGQRSMHGSRLMTIDAEEVVDEVPHAPA